MKKYIMLLSLTAAILSGVLCTGSMVKNSVISVSVMKLEPETAENSIICSGKVERTKTKNVYTPVSAITKEVYVNVGETVEKGQPLLAVSPVQKQTNSENIPQSYQSILESYQIPGSDYSSYMDSITKEEVTESDQPTVQEVLAPVSGQVVSVLVGNDGYTNTNTPVVVIADNPGLQVRLSVNESQISELSIGQKAVISGVGFKDTFEGEVKSISSEATQLLTAMGQETVVEVVVTVMDPTAEIKPGFTAKTKIITAENEGVLIVPYEAVKAESNGKEYVFKIVGGNRAVKIPVVTGEEFENGFQILSGLKKDDMIITSPDSLSNGAHIIPKMEGVSK